MSGQARALTPGEVQELLEWATPGEWKRLGTPTIWSDLDSGRRIAIAENRTTNIATGDLIAAAPALARRVLELEAENARLLDACVQQEREMQQVLGKALGYPYYADDQVTFPGATVEDGVCVFEDTASSLAVRVAAELARAQAGAQAVAGLREAASAVMTEVNRAPGRLRDDPRYVGYVSSNLLVALERALLGVLDAQASAEGAGAGEVAG